MLGFAIVDRQPDADATAVWLTSREGTRVSHTNAVVIRHDDDTYNTKVRALTADRAVVLTNGTTPPIEFVRALNVDAFDGMITETAAHRQKITEAVADYTARNRNRNLVTPDFPAAPKLVRDQRNEPQYRALSTANYIAAVWSAWLATDEQRARRTTEPRTGINPWIMPTELGDPALATFPPEFSERVKPEPII